LKKRSKKLLHLAAWVWLRRLGQTPDDRGKSFLVLFFKKELLAYLLPAATWLASVGVLEHALHRAPMSQLRRRMTLRLCAVRVVQKNQGWDSKGSSHWGG
jgi:hypothetical protein